jgi:hypothetical protein
MLTDQKVKETGHRIDPPTFFNRLSDTPEVSTDVSYQEQCPASEERPTSSFIIPSSISVCPTYQVKDLFNINILENNKTSYTNAKC